MKITEYVFSPFHHPNPYKIHHVAEYRFIQQVGEFLVRTDSVGVLTPGLAEAWHINQADRTLTFKLRSDLYSACEVYQSLRRLYEYGQSSHSNLKAQIESVDCIQVDNENTLTIKAKGSPEALLKSFVMSDTCILPDSAWKMSGDEPRVDWSKSRGPYVFAKGQPLDLPESNFIFVPNRSHYVYETGQLEWETSMIRPEKVNSKDDLTYLFSNKTAYTTVRNWDLSILNELFSQTTLQCYETKINGISFLVPNLINGALKDRAIRTTLARNLSRVDLCLRNEKMRAQQVAQPGSNALLNKTQLAEIIHSWSEPGEFLERPLPTLRWLIPSAHLENGEWVKQISRSSGFPSDFVFMPYASGTVTENRINKFDVVLLSVGMSEKDPVSCATFLYSPTSLDQDYTDGRLLKRLNEAKSLDDELGTMDIVKGAYAESLREAHLIPISYVTNRHYFSKGVELNIKDTHTESTRIWDIRLRD